MTDHPPQQLPDQSTQRQVQIACAGANINGECRSVFEALAKGIDRLHARIDEIDRHRGAEAAQIRQQQTDVASLQAIANKVGWVIILAVILALLALVIRPLVTGQPQPPVPQGGTP